MGGLERVYEIGRVFRNEGVDTRHNPEFTLMELYQAYTDYYGMMELVETMFREVAKKVLGTAKLIYDGVEIDLEKPFERITMVDALKKYKGIDFTQIKTDEEAKALADQYHIEYEARHKKGDILSMLFEEFVEEHLVQPTFILDHPIEMDQIERFKAQEALLAAGDEEANSMDEDFVNALMVGMPPTGGIGIGMDRFIMLLTDSYAIRDVLLFPTMKTLGGNDVSKKEEKTVITEEKAAEKIDFSNVKIEPLFEEMVDFETFAKSDYRAVKIKDCTAVPKSKKLLQFTLDDGSGADRTILSGIHEYYEPEELIGKTAIAIVNLPPRKMMGIDSCGMLISAVHEEDGKEGLNLLMVDDRIPAGAKLY